MFENDVITSLIFLFDGGMNSESSQLIFIFFHISLGFDYWSMPNDHAGFLVTAVLHVIIHWLLFSFPPTESKMRTEMITIRHLRIHEERFAIPI